MQMDIDQQCSQIIAKRQPAAVDLRMILTVVKIVNDLERVGDEIKKIAYKAQQMQQPERLTTVRVHVITRVGRARGGEPPARARRLRAPGRQRRGDGGQQRRGDRRRPFSPSCAS